MYLIMSTALFDLRKTHPDWPTNSTRYAVITRNIEVKGWLVHHELLHEPSIDLRNYDEKSMMRIWTFGDLMSLYIIQIANVFIESLMLQEKINQFISPQIQPFDQMITDKRFKKNRNMILTDLHRRAVLRDIVERQTCLRVILPTHTTNNRHSDCAASQ